MTGRYTCEVSTEGIFETVKASAEMTVVGGMKRRSEIGFYSVVHLLSNKVLLQIVLAISRADWQITTAALLHRQGMICSKTAKNTCCKTCDLWGWVRLEFLKSRFCVQVRETSSYQGIYLTFLPTHFALIAPSFFPCLLSPRYCSLIFLVSGWFLFEDSVGNMSKSFL